MKIIKSEGTFRHAEPLPFEEPEERAAFLVRTHTEFVRRLVESLGEPDDTPDVKELGDQPIVLVEIESAGRAGAAPVAYGFRLIALVPHTAWVFMDDSENALNLSALMLKELERKILFFANDERLRAREEARAKRIGYTDGLTFEEFVDLVNAAESTDSDADTRKEEVK